MKCPNCNNEALFVNGKYVCVDCGIEITPEQQAAQAQSDDLGASLAPQPETPSLDVNQFQVEAEAPITPQPEVEAPTSTEPIEKPVEEAVKSELESTDQPEVEEQAGGGVYDFDQPSSQEPASDTSLPVTESQPEIPEPVVDALPQPEVGGADYFQPNSFDMKAEQVSAEPEQQSDLPETTQLATDNVVPEAQLETSPSFDAYSTPAGIGAGEPTLESLQDKQAVQTEEPVEIPIQVETQPEPNLEQPIVTPENPPQAQSLDEMLNSAASTPQPAASVFPVDNMNQTAVDSQLEIASNNVTTEGQMPSIESVFGGNNGAGGAGDTPTPQDFGLPAPEPQNENKKRMLIIGGSVGAVLLIIIILLFVFLGGNSSPYPVSLNTEQVTTLSSRVSESMSGVSESTVEYNMNADFGALSISEGVSEAESEILLKTFETGLTTNGIWLKDDQENIYVSSLTNEKSDKKTYIKKDKKTYVYSEKDSEWNEKKEDQIKNVPPFFAPQSQGAVLYGTNIQSASLTGVELIEGTEYKSYEVKPNQGVIQDLTFLGGSFADAGYSSVNADNLKITVLVAPDYKIRRVSVNGFINVQTEKFIGAINLDGVADYSYQDVVIQNPGSSAGADPPNTVATNNQGEKEEGEPSLINNEPIEEEVEGDVGEIDIPETEVLGVKG